jgi:hypothetical protein
VNSSSLYFHRVPPRAPGKIFKKRRTYRLGEKRRDRISDLSKCGVHFAGEREAIRERLKPCGFPYGNGPLLSGVPMDVGIRVLAHMRRQRPGWLT